MLVMLLYRQVNCSQWSSPIMVIFEGVTLIYLYNVPLRPHGVYCQHESQWGNIFLMKHSYDSFFFNFVCAGQKISESPFLHSSMYCHVEFFDKSVKKGLFENYLLYIHSMLRLDATTKKKVRSKTLKIQKIQHKKNLFY